MSHRDVQRKQETVVFLWAPRIEKFLESPSVIDDEYIKVMHIVYWLEKRYATFREFKPIYKRALVGRVLTHLGHEKYSYGVQGFVYRRKKDVVQGLPHIPDVSGSQDIHT